ncbi:uncharacterized protein LOC116211026 [Punica granatum]|uniref:Uncharacterized protein LOC116211026 n=1 Tax=Punica granatum TaxID=22663 RepID=A0A218XX23_PUNGR|nr:uncharacterized protein LOC116211026 [Punica granatum]OWM88832.1 hypothetical protein CDL15_Pgr020786 [Punica granatum]
MRFGALRSIIQPLSRTLASQSSSAWPRSARFIAGPGKFGYGFCLSGVGGGAGSLQSLSPWYQSAALLHSLTDTRYPKRRPVDKPRRKRASLKPPGPYAWVKYVPGQPILPNQPNEGSVKRRNEKKRIRLRKAFIKSEAKKRKVQMQAAKRRKINERVERKMAAVARERAWAQRLAELQQLEEEKKKSMA